MNINAVIIIIIIIIVMYYNMFTISLSEYR